jgi:hypothetical protein
MADLDSLLQESRWELQRLDDVQCTCLAMAICGDDEGAKLLARKERGKAAQRRYQARRSRAATPWKWDFSADGLV